MAFTDSRCFRSWSRHSLVGLAAAALAGLAPAEEAAGPEGGLRFSGFGSLGVTHTSAPAGWGFRRELTQPGRDETWSADVDSRLGLQLNYSLGSRFELVAQVIGKRRALYARDGDALEWAYAAWRPDAHWTLRLGRVNLDTFLMADYRNVGYGFTAARPPVELYGMLPTALDGADVGRSWLDGDTQWRVKLMAGTASIGDPQTTVPSRVRRLFGAMLSRDEGGLLLRGSAARTRIDIDLSGAQPIVEGLNQLAVLPIPAVANQARQLSARLGTAGIWTTFLELGVRQELADWQWSVEAVHIDAAPLIKQSSVYATVGRHLGDWTPFIGYGRTRDGMPVQPEPAWLPLLSPLLGPSAAAQAQSVAAAVVANVNGTRVQQAGWSVGLRWDFHPQAALKLQWDRMHIGQAGSGLWTRASGQPSAARVATAVVDFMF
ncbi:hypothetical protein [Pelomonas cellulosilytica]|nr:hypothetical protein [Pelomonas sp. P8]